jgi:hypothetical protein
MDYQVFAIAQATCLPDLYGPDSGQWVEQLKATQNLLGSISDSR